MRELSIMILGKTAKLRPWREEDIQKLTEFRNDIDLQAQLLTRVRGSHDDQTRRWLEQRSSNDNLLFVVADRDSDTPMGYIQFIDIDPIDQTAKLGICVAPTAQNKGLGKEVLTLALNYLHAGLGVRKVILEVSSCNKRAIHCYEKIGFKQCGMYLNHKYITGIWHDVIVMELFLETLVKQK